MKIKDYRERLEQEIAAERAAGADPAWDERLEAAHVHERVGLPTGTSKDIARLRETLENRDNDPDLRVAALGALCRRHSDVDTLHVVPLERLSDSTEAASVRIAAMQILKAALFQSPTAAEWRATFLDALRGATEAADDTLRNAAFETLALMKDRRAQQALLRGLEDPAQARVPPENALRLLAQDPHSGVQSVARELAAKGSSEAVRLEALGALAGDSESTEMFRSLLGDSGESLPIRKLAATALRSLAPKSLRRMADEMPPESERTRSLATDSVRSDSDQQLRKHVEALLDGV